MKFPSAQDSSRLPIVLPVVFCLAAAVLSASGGPTVVHSPSRRFIVVCNDPASAMPVAGWADDVAVRVERVARLKIAPGDGREARIFLATNPALSRAGASVAIRGARPGNTSLKIEVAGLEDVDWEDALEKWCAVLLDGCVAGAATNGAAGRAAPEWLSSGLAHCIDPALRARDRKILLRLADAGLTPGMAEILGWEILPPGRRHEKAVCASAVAWMFSDPETVPAISARVLESIAAGRKLDAGAMAELMPGYPDAAALEAGWRSRIEAERNVLSDIGIITEDALRELRAAVAVESGADGVPAGAQLRPGAGLEAVITARTNEWAAAFCRGRAIRIARLKPGRPREFTETADAYCAFLSAVAGGRAGERRLKSMLATAMTKMDEMERLFYARVEFMDRMEEKYGGEPGPEVVLEQPETREYIWEKAGKPGNERAGPTNAAQNEEKDQQHDSGQD